MRLIYFSLKSLSDFYNGSKKKETEPSVASDLALVLTSATKNAAEVDATDTQEQMAQADGQEWQAPTLGEDPWQTRQKWELSGAIKKEPPKDPGSPHPMNHAGAYREQETSEDPWSLPSASAPQTLAERIAAWEALLTKPAPAQPEDDTNWNGDWHTHL